MIGFGALSGVAQQPGTPPPNQFFAEQDPTDDGLPIGAFLYLSASNNLVMVPGMTLENAVRLMDMDASSEVATNAYSYQSLEIEGSTLDARAELEIRLQLTVEATGDRWISIPIKMKNFFLLAPPDVSGMDEFDMKLTLDDTGYLLLVKTASTQDLSFRMPVAVRVNHDANGKSLAFQLPNVPTKVSLRTDGTGVGGEVIGSGDETVTALDQDDGPTRLEVESVGGTFELRWRKIAESTDALPLLESDSRIRVRWDSPSDQPIVSVTLTALSLRGLVESFDLLLPSGSTLRSPPQFGTSGENVELGPATTGDRGDTYTVVVPEPDRRKRVDLLLDMQISSNDPSEQSPLLLRIPEIVGAIRSRGEIDVVTGGSYRLRWRPNPWTRGEPGTGGADGISGRVYRFRFDREEFELPIWLGTKERQLQLTTQSRLTVRESDASLDMTIRVSNPTADGTLRFDHASWQLRSIEDLDTGQPLDWYESDGFHMIEISDEGRDGPLPIRILADRSLNVSDGLVELSLPRVTEASDAALIQNASVDIVNSGRSMFVVDLEKSNALRRLSPAAGEPGFDSLERSFQLLNTDSPPVLVGRVIDQPEQITLSGSTTIELVGGQLLTEVAWNISSRIDLEGRLPIRIPASGPRPTDVNRSISEGPLSDARRIASFLWETSDPKTNWDVTVNGAPALLRALDADRYELISDRLAAGEMEIHWHHAENLRSQAAEGTVTSTALPRPNIDDVTILGSIPINLQGDEEFDLVLADIHGLSNLPLDSLPRDPIRVKLQSRATSQQELSIRQTVLRTAVGRATRHEQVLAATEGGEEYRVGLPGVDNDPSALAFVDGQSVPVRRDGDELVVGLPGDSASHIVDLRVWIEMATPAAWATVEPILKLPLGSGRVFWQVVSPVDGHVVWAAPTLGRSMSWRFDRWQLFRRPTHGDKELTAMTGSVPNDFPRGNRYLYIGSDVRSFQVMVVSRSVLWALIGTLVLVSAAILSYFPRSRHPITVVAAGVGFAGLLAIAPDAAVLAGQLGIVTLVSLVVLITIRSLIVRGQSTRVFTSPRSATVPNQPSTRTVNRGRLADQPAVPTTHTLPRSAPSEASP